MRVLFFSLAAFATLSSAMAAPFTSADFHFSADFPGPVQKLGPDEAEHDAEGKVISHAMTFRASRANLYAVAVTVDTFDRPARVDAQQVLTRERDTYLAAGRSTQLSSAAATIAGHPAMRFSYESRADLVKGEGLVVVVQSATPRIYFVVAERSGNAGTREITLLDRFIKSFQVTE